MERQRASVFTPRLVLGLLLAVGGVLWLFDRLDVLHHEVLASWWPLALVGLGGIQLGVGDNRFARVLGLGLVLLGGALVLANLAPELLASGEVWSWAWPIALAGLGLVLVANALSPPRPPSPVSVASAGSVTSAASSAGDRVRVFAFWSGSERLVSSPSFRGGELTAIMGGYELDLRAADIPDGEEAVLDVFALMGGGTILVPESWTVQDEVLPFMGGVSVSARAPAVGSASKRLRITGLALMGGIEVLN